MQNLHLYVVLIAFAFSGISWAYRKLAEQKAIRDQQRELVRQREAMLRTGRTEPTVASTNWAGGEIAVPNAAQANARADTQAQALNSRREAQLAEQRRKQVQSQQSRQTQSDSRGSNTRQGQPVASASRGSAQPLAAGSGPQTIELWPGGPVVTINPTGTPANSPASPTARQQQVPQQARPAPTPARRDQRPGAPQPKPTRGPSRPQPQDKRRADDPISNTEKAAAAQRREFERAVARKAPTDDERQAQRSADNIADRLEAIRARAADIRAGRFATPTSPAEWRQAIVASEVLSQPIALRGTI